jgi:DNA-binding NarL/FixJ family response regulator
MTAPVRVVIADDQQLIRASLRVLVESQAGFVVVGEAGNGQDAVAVTAAERPDVVLMDVRMPILDGIEATRQIAAMNGAAVARVLMLTTYDLDEYVYSALRAGASGFLLKDAPPEDLLAAIRIVAGGEALLAPAITKRLIAEFAARPEPKPRVPAAIAGISGREREVLLLVARGRSNAEIAEDLHISLATAKTYVSRLLTKLDAKDRVHLVIVAYESRLIEPG